MKIGILIPGFEENTPGGLSNVANSLISILGPQHSITILSFANSVNDTNSIRIGSVRTYRRRTISETLSFGSMEIVKIGTIGSEFEFLRYRSRIEHKKIFEKFSLLIVVTGVLQFANVLPRLNIPVLVQCATRMSWERKSQYPKMSFWRRLVLKLQIPLFLLQEQRVLRKNVTFLVENSVMFSWLKQRTTNPVKLWYPSTQSSSVMKFEPSSNKSHFISVGRFNDPRKGWDRLFEAYRNAYLILPSLPKLLVIGWGNFSNFDQTVLEEAQRNSPIEVYRNLDNVERDKYVRESSYFLQTSHEEGLGLAALEALQFGKPLICSETDGSKEYINDLITGKKIKQGANFVSEFCKALLESQNWDYHLMSQNAFRLFNTKFSFHLSSETLNKIINEIQ